jgi:hypothetical protein
MTALESILHIVGSGPYSMDGLNEEGLSAAFLWLDGSRYPDFNGGTKQLLWVDVVNYILGRFKTVEEVNHALTDPQNADYFTVGGYAGLSDEVPLHVIVHDKTGKSLLVEWIAGKQSIYMGGAVDNVGVLTNEPEWPEQLKNLDREEYRNAKPENEMAGIPGDSTRMRYASMFVYAVTPDQEFYQWWNNRWIPVTNGLLVPTYTGTFATKTFGVNLNKLPISAENQYGTKIYAGWGTSSTEMLLAQRQNMVFVISDFEEYQIDP